MAITIYNQPDTVCSVKSPIIFDVVSDSTDITTVILAQVFYRRNIHNFYRISGRKIDGKRSGYNYFRFNLAGTLEKLLSFDNQTGDTSLNTSADNSAIEFYVKFTEYYPNTGFSAHDTTTSSSFYAHNTALLVTETQGIFTDSDWYMDGEADHRFLTNAPLNQYIRDGETIQFGFITSYTTARAVFTKYLNDGTSSSTTHTFTESKTHYLWDWTVDANEDVTIGTPEASTTYIESITAGGGSGYVYMPDNSNKMWGGVQLVANNDEFVIVLPVIAAASAVIEIVHKALTAGSTFTVSYFYSGVYNLSALGTQTSSTSAFTTFSETLPSGTTKVKIKKTASAGQINFPFADIVYANTSIINKRGQFNIDSTEFDSTVNYAEIYIDNGGSAVRISEIRRLTRDGSYVDVTSRFKWVNPRGDMDSFTFKVGHNEEINVDKVTFIKELPVGFTAQDRERGVAFVNSDMVFTSYTEYMDDLDWLKELLESKEVYLDTDGVLVAVDVLTSAIDTDNHDLPLVFELQWRFAHRRNV